jgi:hypothetical protein
MLNQIQNTFAKILDLRKGLILLGLLSILVSGFVIGGGVRAEAGFDIPGTPVFKITYREAFFYQQSFNTRSNDVFPCDDLYVKDELNNSLNLSRVSSPSPYFLNCFRAFLPGKKIPMQFTQCVFINAGGALGVGGGIDAICKKGEKRNFVKGDIDIKSDDTEGKSDFKPTHKIVLDNQCKDFSSGNYPKGNFKCDESLKAAEDSNPIKNYCWGYPDNQTYGIVCDDLDVAVGSNTSNTQSLSDNGWVCVVKTVANSAAYQGLSVSGWSCSKGVDKDIDRNDTKNQCGVFNARSQNNNTAKDLIIRLSCQTKTITFSDGKGTQPFWFSNQEFLWKDGDTWKQVNQESLAKLCKVDESSDLESEVLIGSDGNINCKNVKQADFLKEYKTAEAADTTNNFQTGDNKGGAVGQAKVGSNAPKADNPLGGLFTVIYQIVAAIIMAFLFLIRYLQMTVLLLFISVMTVLLNLSPNTGFLTTLAVPLWSIFAQIASLGAVGILIFLGSATMIGIEGFEYDKTIAKGAQVAIYVFVSNFTYFGLAFAISLLDGFTKLIVFVFGGGSVFKLFEALIASVSSISKVGPGTSLIPDLNNIGASVGAVFGTMTKGGGAGNITTTLVKEIIVVVGLGLIIWVFGRIFFMLLTRVAILLLLLITSPIWVLGILVKDSLPQELKPQVDKAVNLVSGTIIFNFAFITTLVLVTIITQKVNGGISDFQKSVADAFVPATNTGLAFIDGISANAQTGGTLSNDAFLGFGAGGFGETISVCAVLGINLAIIYFAFDAIANLIDTNIVNVGKAVGGAVSKNLQNFRKADSFGQGLAMMGQDAFKYGTLATTGGNGLIADAGGAAAKLGNKSVKLGAKGINSSFKFATNKGEYRTNQLGRLNRTVSNPLSDLAVIARNPGRSLRNTTFDMLGIKNKETNDAQIADYNKKKARNSGGPLTKEEEEKQIKRLELARKFEENAKLEAKQAGDDSLNAARASTDLTTQSEVRGLDASKAAMEGVSTALELETKRLSSFTEQLKKFQEANGYTDDTLISDMKGSDRVDATRLRSNKTSLKTSVDNMKADLNTKTVDFNNRNKELRGKTGGVYNDDIVINQDRKVSNLSNQSTQAKADLVNAKPNLTTTTVNLVDRYSNNATKIKEDIDGYAGNKSYAFKDEAAFQEDTAKRLEKTQSIQEQQLEATKKQTEALERLFNSNRTPPPGP